MLDMEAIKNFSIDKSNWKKVKFGDVVFEPKESVKDPLAEGIEHVVGLEHIDSEDIHLHRSASVEEGAKFTKKFSKGDVLFGRRRAYLKKAAKAKFEGVCSGDITVMRCKEEKLLPELLPFLVNNDQFFDYAVMHSAGGLSPRVKFKDIAKYELLLPSLSQQVSLINLFKAKDDEICSYKKLKASFEIFKTTKLNELFIGNVHKKCDADWLALSEYCQNITYGFTNPMPTVESGIFMVTATNIRNGQIDYKNTRKTSIEAFEELITKKSRPEFGDVLLTKDGRLGELAIVGDEKICINQSVAVLRPNENITSEYLFNILQVPFFQNLMLREAGGTTIKHIYITKIAKMKIPVPSREEQNRLCSIANNIYDQKLEVETSLNTAIDLQKAMIKQVF